MATAFGKKPMPSSFAGKSTQLGGGGRAAKLKSQGVPGGVIGQIARKKKAAPGQANYKGGAGLAGFAAKNKLTQTS